MKAYFSYINSRKSKVDGKRGVYGRQILLNVYDDQYSEAQTSSRTRKAVEQDHVFAMLGGLGTENQLAVRDYLNDKKVPQLYVSTGPQRLRDDVQGAPVDDRLAAGLRPGGHPASGRYAKANLPNAKVAVLYQNDDYGKEWLYGFQKTRRQVGDRRVAELPARRRCRRDLDAASARLRASGADTLLVIATPTESITALVVAYRLGWKPNKLVNSVGATDAFMTAAQNSAGSPDAVNGVVSTTYPRIRRIRRTRTTRRSSSTSRS